MQRGNMPSPSYIPAQPRQENPLGNLLSSYLTQQNKNIAAKDEGDALKEIYSQYQGDGNNLMMQKQAVLTDPRISPTTRVNTIKQLNDFAEHNEKLQKNAKEDLEKQEKKAKKDILAQEIKQKHKLTDEQAEAYVDNPTLYGKMYPKEGRENQADRPINKDQLDRIQHVRSKPEYEKASPSKKYQMLTDNGVSERNAKSESDIFAEEAKIEGARNKILTEAQAKNDVAFAQEQISKIPQIASKQRILEGANDLNEKGVTGGLFDKAMKEAGLLQFTSEGYRVFTSIAKDVVKNAGIKDTIGSQISQQEFRFFTDATVNPDFNKEANRAIIKKDLLALRYEKLYADITKSMIDQNDGVIPERFQQKVNDEFLKQSEDLTEELKQLKYDYEAITDTPKDKVLMYDKRRNPILVNPDEVKKYSNPPYGATLS